MDNEPDILVLFDDGCNVCAGSVAFLTRHDSQCRFQYLSIQSADGRKLYENEGLDPENIQTFVLIRNKRAFFKSDAAIEAANALGGFWRCLNVFRIVPKLIRDAAYAYFAKNRYRWFGRREL